MTRRTALRQLLSAASLAAASSPKLAMGDAAQALFGDASRLTDLGMSLSPEQREAGRSFLERYVSVDTHCHPGRFFLSDLEQETDATRVYGAPFEERVIADFKTGNVSAGLFSCVADLKLAEITPKGVRATRDFMPGEAFADYQRQIRALKSFAAKPGLSKGRSPADLSRAHAKHDTAAVFAVEGGDFIEDRLDRIHTAYEDGVRAITIVHYHINQIGDIQTQPAVHNGLTELGKKIIREMNRRGIIIDLAHAPLSVTRDTVEISSRPVLLSHSNLVTPDNSYPRLITAEHAKLVAAAGGVIGAWPVGIGQSTFADYIDSIQRLVDAVGIEHVAIGTDMDANYKPVFRNYDDWSLLPAALLARGMREREVAAIMGGNFMRIFRAQ